VKATGEIGLFIIAGESSIGTGLRRIEAVTGRKAGELVQDSLKTIAEVAAELRSSPAEITARLKALTDELVSERKRSASLEQELSRYTVQSLLDKAEKINGITVLSARVPPTSFEILRQMGDSLKDRLKSAVIVLGTVYDDKPGFVAMVTPDLVGKGFNAGNIVKQVAGVTGGGGGGKANMAQAGGKDKDKLDDALGIVKKLVRKAGA
jgi:alanyl-tRNA synthetase